MQEVWERHEGAFSGAWEVAVAAVASRDGAGGATEARLAAAEVRAMGGLAAGTNPGVAAHLQAAADALEAAATAFGTADFTTAQARLAEAENEHEITLSSTTRKDWC